MYINEICSLEVTKPLTILSSYAPLIGKSRKISVDMQVISINLLNMALFLVSELFSVSGKDLEIYFYFCETILASTRFQKVVGEAIERRAGGR